MRDNLRERIAEDLELDDYNFPIKIRGTKDKLSYILFNYLMKAKELYRATKLPDNIRDVLGKLYIEAIKINEFHTDTKITMRALNTAFKTLRALASLRLSKIVDERDFNYFREKCLRLIIAFRDSKLTENQVIDLDQIFRITFDQNIFYNLQKTETIHIKKHIQMIRAYIKINFYASKSDENFKKEIDNYMPKNPTLRNNWKYRKILENNEDWLNGKNIKIISIPREGSFFCIKKEFREKTDKKINFKNE